MVFKGREPNKRPGRTFERSAESPTGCKQADTRRNRGRPQALASFTCAMSALGTWGKRNAAMSVCALRREAEVGLGLVRRVGATDAQAKVDLGVSEPGPMTRGSLLSLCRGAGGAPSWASLLPRDLHRGRRCWRRSASAYRSASTSAKVSADHLPP